MSSYDPQRDRRPLRAVDGEEAPVDRLLDGVDAEPEVAGLGERPWSADPSEPTSVPVVPDIGEADPDLRFKIGVMGGVAAAVALIALWARRRGRR